MEFMPTGGKKSLYNTIKLVIYTFGGIGIVVFLFIGWLVLNDPKEKSLEDLLAINILWMVPFALFALGYHYQRKEDKEEYPPSFVFDRARGVVVVPQLGKFPGGEYPFEDVEGYSVRSASNQFGLQDYFLRLVIYEPSSEEEVYAFYLWAGPIQSYEQALAHWSRLCQYMNKSEPLPNIPQLWEAMADQLIRHRGWWGRAGREAAMDEVTHAFAQTMRSEAVSEDLGVEPHVDPTNRDYEGPRSYEYYRRLYPREA
jgi:hypothetical protein